MTGTPLPDLASPRPYHAPEGYDRVLRCPGWSCAQDRCALSLVTAQGLRAELTLELIEEGIWRCRLLPPTREASASHERPHDAPVFPDNPMLLPGVRGRLPLSAREENGVLEVTGGLLSFCCTLEPISMAFRDPAGRAVWRDNPADLDGLGRPFVPPLGLAGHAGPVPGEAGRKVFLAFHLAPEERLFGLGEKFTPLDKRGQRIISWTVDALGSTSERSHKNVPLLISTRGYGLFLASGARITWDLGVSSCQSAAITVDDDRLEWFLIHGPQPADVLRRYTHLTGAAPVPPKWSFGLWVSSGGTYRDRAAMETLLDGLTAHEVPADVVHVDPWWMRWRTYCDFRWDEEAFPHPEEFIASVHARGMKLCLWEHPYISVESDLFALGRERGYFLRRPDGTVYVIDYGLSRAPRPDGVVRAAAPENSWNARVAIVDLTHPGATAWFKDLHRPLLRMGVDVFKTDFGEDIPEDALFADGSTGRTMHNLYPLLYNQAVSDVTREERGHGLVWARSATAGSQRTPVCWSGDPAADFDSLAATVRGGLSAGLSGISFWSNDIGGYRGMPSAELYVRWAQYGLLCSHSRMHGDSPREPWHFGTEALTIVRSVVRFRSSLFPYLYSAAYEASHTGLPVLRALPLAFPDDPLAAAREFEFLLGPSLLVAPVLEPARTRTLYLPEGEWIDIWTDLRYPGKQLITLPAPLERIPLLARAGAILPRMEPAMHIPEGIVDPLLLDLYPAGTSSFVLRDDDGETLFRVTEEEGAIVLSWRGARARRLTVRWHMAARPSAALLLLDGAERPMTGDALVALVRSGGMLLPSGREGRLRLTCSPGAGRPPRASGPS